MYCIYEKKVQLCSDERTKMPVGYLTDKGNYECYKCDFNSVEEAQVYLSKIGAKQRHEFKPNEKCIDCIEYIIIKDNFKDYNEKILPSYLKC